MDPKPTPAPVDHFSLDRHRLVALCRNVYQLRKDLPLLRRVAGGTHLGAISAFAAVAAYLPTHAFGLKEGFWSSITAISVVQTEFQATQTTARDQFIGAAVGGIVAVGASLAVSNEQNLFVYAGAIIVSMLVCWALNFATASRLAGSTATIILLVPHAGSAQRMFGARLAEVGWGVCVAVAIVWLAGRVPAKYFGLAPEDPKL